MNSAKCVILLILMILFAACLQNTKKNAVPNYKASGPITLHSVHDITIKNIAINTTNQAGITLNNCVNVTITNCRLSNLRIAIKLYRCRNVVVKKCYIKNTSTGIYVLESKEIKVVYNQIKNVLGPFPLGQAVQFDNVGGIGNRVNYNRCENIAGKSNPEDVISMYKTNGIATDPVQIIGNWIRGGGPSKTGGGIMLGDKGGSYIVAKYNRLVNPGQYGMAISGGTHMQITGNRIYAIQRPYTNIGMYVWAQSLAPCGFNIVGYNQVNWSNAQGANYCSWNQGNCNNIINWDSNVCDSKINEAIIPAKFIRE